MSKDEQRKIIDELMPSLIEFSEKANRLGLDFFITVHEQKLKSSYVWMLYENSDVVITDGKIRRRYAPPENPVWGQEEETTSLPAASEK